MLEHGLVAARTLVPPLGAEVVAKFVHLLPAPAMIAAVDHAALLVPFVDRLKVACFG